MNVPIGAIALVVTTVSLRLPFPRRQARLHLIGAALMVTGVTALVLAAQGEWRRAPVGLGREIVGLFTAGGVISVLFVVWERRVAEPLVPLRLFGNSVVAVAIIMSFLLGAVLYSSPYNLPMFLQDVSGVSARNSGLRVAPQVLGMTVVLVGAAIGLNMPVFSTVTQNAVDLRDIGVGTSALTFFRALDGSFGLATFGAVFKSRLNAGLADLAANQQLPAGVGPRTSQTGRATSATSPSRCALASSPPSPGASPRCSWPPCPSRSWRSPSAGSSRRSRCGRPRR